jgi:uncharacterized protein YaaR (DUF327 family)
MLTAPMPIRIRDRSSAEAVSRSRPAGPPNAKPAAGPAAFGAQLAAAAESLVRKDLDRLYLDVEQQGRRLLARPTPEELGQYKQRVREFVAFVVKHGLKLRSSFGARDLHLIVERLDEALLALADTLLARERPLLDLAARIDSINGMLLDLKA